MAPYIDAFLGWHWYSWQDLHDSRRFTPSGRRTAGRIPRGSWETPTSAIFFFTDPPGMFGAGQVRDAGAVNFNRQGRTERWVDYWGRIERFTAVWNRAYADDAMLTAPAQKAIER